MKLKIELSCRDDNHHKKYIAELFDGNIFIDDKNILPGCSDKVMNFTYQYRPTYDKYSNGKVNTRFSYPYSGGYKNSEVEGAFKIFAKLNWYERQKLRFIARDSWFHKHPIAAYTFLFNTILGLANIVFAIINFNLQSDFSYQKTTTEQTKLLIHQSDLIYMQIESINKLNEKHNQKPDSLSLKETK